jgi:hypothetical protein
MFSTRINEEAVYISTRFTRHISQYDCNIYTMQPQTFAAVR